MEKFNSLKELGLIKERFLEEEIKKVDEIKKEILSKIKPFIEDAIKKGELSVSTYGSHGHLGYKDDKFWGHYIYPTKDGVSVTVYFNDEIRGDPMDIEGERGNSINIKVPLDNNLKKKLIEKINEEVDLNQKDFDEMCQEDKEWGKSDSTLAGLYQFYDETGESISLLESGLEKK